MRKIGLYIALFLLSMFLFYMVGPKFPKPIMSKDLPIIDINVSELDQYILNQEKGLKIKPDNESRIIWSDDSLNIKTEYCLLYLHGFSASWFEGNPVHIDFASRYGMNLYLPRLASHGINTTEALVDMTPDRLYESAKEALVIAHILGEKVIIMGTSTGGTLGLKLTADFPNMVESLILLSPNIEINNDAAFMLNRPWGLQIARMVSKSNYRITNPELESLECQYWNCKQRLEATVYLKQLLDVTMNKNTFQKVRKPVFLGYYYKDENNQDDVVRVDAMLNMFDQLGTSDSLKVKMSFPNAGTHVIGCKMFSGSWTEVENASFDYAENKLNLIPVN